MEFFKYPPKQTWDDLCQRPVQNQKELKDNVSNILREVKEKGDQALKFFSKQFDEVQLEQLRVSASEIQKAEAQLSNDLKQAIQLAFTNIKKFHASQKVNEKPIETQPGVKCWRKSIPIDKVGLYIPGGSAPLFSTLLMLGVPAKLAGCPEIVVCTPVGKNAKVHPAILYTAKLLGIDQVYKTGGAQAIAAMAFGTESIPQTYKIFGPGNQYVTTAKQLVQQEGVAIDMPAGPSEVLVIADESSDPTFVAADLLSQAEHGPDSQVILTSNSKTVIQKVLEEVETQLEVLPRKEITSEALVKSKAVMLNSLQEAMDFSNTYAPEHLIIATEAPMKLAESVRNAGSVFLGNYSCESAGDYASGTNHTLPTNGFARSYSGVSLDSFFKKVTFQQLDEEGIRNIGPAIEQMAAAEQLDAHKNAMSLRLKAVQNYV
ncbi:histidinol dehydrogenase [Xanthovirga aplysinae]|uniref:histidinol dehydrogenase n=1 Tax=Xanthovirga aplysinae TaxID=2529853 RepID=UPI0012BCAC48|nr:histidinol dehydrogenase [Xanthovirga aplysinae]MTI32217.1 histidinol dehydrogenase [Xanthovirga aplysinae]